MTREALKLAYDETWNAGSEYPIPSFDDVISFANKLKFLKENLVLSEKELCPSCRNSDIYACTCTFNPPQRKEPEQEPVAVRMPKVGDKVVCIEDDSLGMVAYLTAGGSPEIRFDDGSHGTYLLREFAKLFRYTTPPQRTWVGLTDDERNAIFELHHTRLGGWDYSGDEVMYDEHFKNAVATIEAKLKEKNT